MNAGRPRPSVVVIGGGIVGLAVTELASRSGFDVTVVEKESEWSKHQTGHNSGVIHAGPYYKPGSLKARMCIAGNISMTKFAQEHNIPHQITGKLIVAVTSDEIPRLARLAERAAANGTPARLISGEDARVFEPHVSAVQALHVERTGIIDYRAVSNRLAQLAAERGAVLVLGSSVVGIKSIGARVVVEHEHGEIEADYLINCAGLQSDRIAKLAGVEPAAQIVPFRGEYYELTPARRDLVRGLIYPTPDPDLPFLGVHFTRMIDGSVHAGPNAVLAFAREAYTWREFSTADAWETLSYPGFLRMAMRNVGTGAGEIVRSLSKSVFAKSLARLIPEVTAADIVPAGAGIRAQAILKDGSLADDFIIQREGNQLHVLNAPSPAATSALEIARHIVNRLKE